MDSSSRCQCPIIRSIVCAVKRSVLYSKAPTNLSPLSQTSAARSNLVIPVSRSSNSNPNWDNSRLSISTFSKAKITCTRG